MKVTEILVACDAVECGYRIVELQDGRYAFVWGNIRSCVGDVLPQEHVDAPLADRGVEVFDSYEAAEDSYRKCADALQQTTSRAGDEMLSVLGD